MFDDTKSGPSLYFCGIFWDLALLNEGGDSRPFPSVDLAFRASKFLIRKEKHVHANKTINIVEFYWNKI